MKPVIALEVPPRTKKTVYPEPFAARMDGRIKRVIGNLFGIEGFGVNVTELKPGGESALLHKHSHEEEFIYVISGRPTLVLESAEYQLEPGSCFGFTPKGEAHQLVNRTGETAFYLEVGTRVAGDRASYPKDDLVAVKGDDGQWKFEDKKGRPY